MTRLDIAIDRIRFARKYTLRLIDSVPESEWFLQPTEKVTHIAWQVGHLAMAQYRLALDRIRGEKPEDSHLISAGFLKHFGKESIPEADPENNPTPTEIRATFDLVYEQTLAEVPKIPDADLDLQVLRPHPLINKRYESLLWCAEHEMVHAGQIGLIRRLLGKQPVW